MRSLRELISGKRYCQKCDRLQVCGPGETPGNDLLCSVCGTTVEHTHLQAYYRSPLTNSQVLDCNCGLLRPELLSWRLAAGGFVLYTVAGILEGGAGAASIWAAGAVVLTLWRLVLKAQVVIARLERGLFALLGSVQASILSELRDSQPNH